jgi:hypothetical protein
MEIIALNCPNPADGGAEPAYQPIPPLSPEFEGRLSAGQANTGGREPTERPGRMDECCLLPAMPEKFGHFTDGFSGAKAKVGNAKRGRRRKYAVEDLVECLGGSKLTTKEFRMAANKRCGMSRAMFYRLLKKGRKELRFRQRGGTCSPWEAV